METAAAFGQQRPHLVLEFGIRSRQLAKARDAVPVGLNQPGAVAWKGSYVILCWWLMVINGD